MLRKLTTELGRTVVVVTHDHRIRRYADRVVTIEDGRIVARPDGTDSKPEGAR
jgi:putative ABC transport system ATP-binding protein